MARKRSAAAITKSLQDTANDYHFGRIDYATFDARQKAHWDQVNGRPRVRTAVLAALRAESATRAAS